MALITEICFFSPIKAVKGAISKTRPIPPTGPNTSASVSGVQKEVVQVMMMMIDDDSPQSYVSLKVTLLREIVLDFSSTKTGNSYI